MHCQGTACARQVDMGLTSAEIQKLECFKWGANYILWTMQKSSKPTQALCISILLSLWCVLSYSLSCQLFSYTKELNISNCDICAEQKISFTNEMKWNEIRSRLKAWVQKIFRTLPPNFGKGHDESCQKFCPSCTWLSFYIIPSLG